jgi:molecular chaperone GrpE (heat shock protein)
MAKIRQIKKLIKEMEGDNYNKIINEIQEVRNDIKHSISPKFLNISIETKDLVEHAIELWRMESRLNKVLPNLDKDIAESISNSFKKLNRYLEKNDIEIIDYTNQKFNEGLNLDILAVEDDPNIEHPKIKETKEPTITHKGEVVNKGKIILVKKENKQEITKNE